MHSESYSIRLDSVQIGVEDLEAGIRQYSDLLGSPPAHTTAECARYQLSRGAVEIVSGGAGLVSVSFVYTGTLPSYSSEGIPLRFIAASDHVAPPPAFQGIDAIDHVVVHSGDLDRALRLYGEQLHLRLALDRSFAQRGLRILFFRSGGITLEVAGSLAPPAERAADRLYGMAYRVTDLPSQRERLERAGLQVSPVRAGFKPGTTVATVSSGTAWVPTLLICDPSRAAGRNDAEPQG